MRTNNILRTFLIIFLSQYVFNSTGNAQTWSAVGGGMTCGAPYCEVSALAVYNGQLYACGFYDSSGSLPAYSISRWNGSSWDSIPGLLGSFGLSCLYTYNGDLYVGGEIYNAQYNTITAHNIVSWNGTVYDSLGTGFGSSPYSMTVYNGSLIAGGITQRAGGIPVNNIASWNGAKWDSLGGGTNKLPDSYSGRSVFALAVYNGNLIAGGIFDSAGRKPAKSIAEWNGVSWSPLGTGTDSTVNALTVYNGNLYAAGLFKKAGGIAANNIAMWNGTTWAALGKGINGHVYTLCEYNWNLYCGGNFDSAGGQPANNIAMWNGTNWVSLGAGTSGSGYNIGNVYALAVYNGNLYVGGGFDSAGGQPANKIAQWTKPASVNNLSDNGGIIVYPNPSNGKFIIQCNVDNEKLKVNIYNMLGQEVYSESLLLSHGDNMINISNESKGLYLYRILTEDGNSISTGKVLIE